MSTYELGRQPFGLASPAAWLREAGAEVACLDLSRTSPAAPSEDSVRSADLIAFYVPMHTATRLAVEWLPRVRAINPRAHLCFYGLYAPLNESYLRRLGAQTILGGEFEESLVALVKRLAAGDASSMASEAQIPEGAQPEPAISLARQRFRIPDRSGLPDLEHYARLEMPSGERRVAGYTEATRGCKHLCRHCPIVPVYQGRFRVVQREVVLSDIRQQVAAGAAHIIFGDPDFFNGVGHSLAIVDDLHREFPRLTYDVTIKIEHLLRYAHLVPRLRATGCLFVTTAVECLDDRVLRLFDKGHTREDFVRVVELFREVGLALSPTFIPFHPWTTVEGYREMLAILGGLNLAESIAPVQLAVRLLIPTESKLLELPEIRERTGEFSERELRYRWTYEDQRVERLYHEVRQIVGSGQSEPRASASGHALRFSPGSRAFPGSPPQWSRGG
ncbi:MAG: CUAEP/CCAEP-tail radical SAM (seleno)protein, partial [Terriglobia bacterium]